MAINHSHRCTAKVMIGRVLIAILLGALLTLAFAPFQIVPLAFVAFSGLLWLLQQGRTLRSAAVFGWAFGLGHFVSSLYWIGYSFFVNASPLGALAAIPAVLGLSALLALFPTLACITTFRLSSGRGVTLWLAFSGLWSSAEWIRGHVFSGFPWNLAGYVWSAAEQPLQTVSFIGIYGLSFITVAVASLPALAFRYGVSWRSRWGAIGATFFAVTILWLAGDVRLSLSATDQNVDAVRLRLVQPNIPQSLKWRQDQRQAIINRLEELSAKPAPEQPTHILWPETATPFMLLEEENARRQSTNWLPAGTVLVTGIVRQEAAVGGSPHLFNSIAALTSTGEVVDVYDKVRLVPFGEYMPLRNILPFEKFTAGSTDFSPGNKPAVMTTPGAPAFRPMICYESIFPGDWPRSAVQPKWMLNLTNDAWFGDSAGPYQHFQMARVRAVERGLPLVRVANTGISSVIDANGRVRGKLALNTGGVLDARLPRKLSNGTFFGKVGNVPFFIMVGLSLLQVALVRLQCRSDRCG